LYRKIIYMRNMQCDALFHLPFSSLRLDQYSSTCFEKPLILTGFLALFPSDCMSIHPIPIRRTWNERGHHTAYFTYRLCCDTMKIQKLNSSESCRTREIQLYSSSNPAPNQAASGVVRVTMQTWASGPVPTPVHHRSPPNRCLHYQNHTNSQYKQLLTGSGEM